MGSETAVRSRHGRPFLLALFYVVAGVTHFVSPRTYTSIVPPQFPRPLALVYLSGIAEIALGVGVLFRRTRRRSAWGLVALLVAVFPANVYMATQDVVGEEAPKWVGLLVRLATVVRLPLQAVLVRWAWSYTRPDAAASG
ncbi:DoxX family protein [Halomarina oriensis]|uniref:DoxX family membrane protein n=1 Tax=Halomarina oriensis TaxID=671145 RepID=A0A6B0GT53_9EURY|nr:MauE/DoxX family redox-associated membrane protein [Halomarina oriensis]MWG35305.1 DoxX family membrane protein [Halomarina oriensis]